MEKAEHGDTWWEAPLGCPLHDFCIQPQGNRDEGPENLTQAHEDAKVRSCFLLFTLYYYILRPKPRAYCIPRAAHGAKIWDFSSGGSPGLACRRHPHPCGAWGSPAAPAALRFNPKKPSHPGLSEPGLEGTETPEVLGPLPGSALVLAAGRGSGAGLCMHCRERESQEPHAHGHEPGGQRAVPAPTGIFLAKPRWAGWWEAAGGCFQPALPWAAFPYGPVGRGAGVTQGCSPRSIGLVPKSQRWGARFAWPNPPPDSQRCWDRSG